MIRFAGGPFIMMIMNVLGRFSYQLIVQSQPTRQHKSRFNHGHTPQIFISVRWSEYVLFVTTRRKEYETEKIISIVLPLKLEE